MILIWCRAGTASIFGRLFVPPWLLDFPVRSYRPDGKGPVRGSRRVEECTSLVLHAPLDYRSVFESSEEGTTSLLLNLVPSYLILITQSFLIFPGYLRELLTRTIFNTIIARKMAGITEGSANEMRKRKLMTGRRKSKQSKLQSART